jgi:hypothetical protein
VSEDVVYQYRTLAEDDERVGKLLLGQGAFRQATYLFLQAMEKYARARIFSIANPTLDTYREQTRTHDLEALLDFLLELAVDADLRPQVQSQLDNYVLGGVLFGQLHNDLRYPKWLANRRGYAPLIVDRSAAETVQARLEALKGFLDGLDRLRR